MQVRAVYLIVLVLLLGCRQGQSRGPSSDGRFSLGEVVPSLELTDLSGATKSLEDYRGKVVLLNFWATWCSPCVAEMPSLERLHQAYKSRGLEVVAVSLDAPGAKGEVIEFVRRSGLTFSVLLDPEAGSPLDFGVTGFPETFFISPEGKILAFKDPMDGQTKLRIISDRPWDSESYLKAVEALLPDKSSSSVSAPSLGSSAGQG